MKQRLELPQVDEVKLPTLFSVRPGIYILAILIILICATVFFVAFYPGIVKGGRYVTFYSPVSESGVYINNTYLGPAGYQHFVESGEHTVTMKKAGIVLDSYKITIDHPVFLTWLFHRTLKSSLPGISLDEQKRLDIIRFNLDQIAQQSAILTFDSVTRYQTVFAHLIQDLQALDIPKERAAQSIELALLYITSEPMLEDALKSLAGSPFEQDEQVQKNLSLARSLFSESEAPQHVQELIPVSLNLHPLAKSSLSYKELQIAGYTYPAASFNMGTQTAWQYPQCITSAVHVEVPSFNLAYLPVSQYQWSLFLEENPFWDRGNKQELMKRGLVDEQYLQGVTISSVFVTNRPVFNVSYHAAVAFTQWLSEKTGKQVILPTQEMWSLAGQNRKSAVYETSLSISPTNMDEPQALLGGVWEITQSSFIPLSRLSEYERAMELHKQFNLLTQPIVKGGSYLNNPNSINPYTVGVVDPDACGDQIGFRIAWYT
jgi:hypothetical protein